MTSATVSEDSFNLPAPPPVVPLGVPDAGFVGGVMAFSRIRPAFGLANGANIIRPERSKQVNSARLGGGRLAAGVLAPAVGSGHCSGCCCACPGGSGVFLDPYSPRAGNAERSGCGPEQIEGLVEHNAAICVHHQPTLAQVPSPPRGSFWQRQLG